MTQTKTPTGQVGVSKELAGEQVHTQFTPNGHAKATSITAADFFRLLYPDPETPGTLVVFPLPSKESRTFPLSELAIAATYAEGQARRQNVYFSVPLQDPSHWKAGSRGEAKTATAIPGVWLDLDFGPHHKAANCPPTIEAAEQLLQEFPLLPSVVVHSGHGLQVYWLFREAWVFDTDEERQEAAGLCRRFNNHMIALAQRHGWHLDNVSDLARVLRVPGTVNRKDGKPEQPVRVLAVSEHRYNPDDIDQYTCETPSAQPVAPAGGRGILTTGWSQDIPEGTRETTLMQIGGAMRGRGEDEAAILAELERVNKARCKPPLPQTDLQRMAHSLTRYAANTPLEAVKEEGAPGSQATRIWREVRGIQGVELFHTPDGEGYITFPIIDHPQPHRETWRLKAERAHAWMLRLYGQRYDTTPNSKAIQDAVRHLSSHALYDGPEYPVHLRTARHEGAIYIDLGDAAWRAVRITAEGWRVVTDHPVKFRRTAGMLPLPEPVTGGSLTELRGFLNVRGDAEWAIVAAFLTMVLHPEGPYPLLNLSGPQGSGKSTQARMLRSLTDPNKAPLRAEPKDLEALNVAADNAHVMAFDNLSSLPGWLSDAFCRLSTGGGAATRKLYTDAEEHIFEAKRPVMLTGINAPMTREDLIDRTILLPLTEIAERRTEADVLAEFEEARPRLFGAILTAMAEAMRNLPTTQLAGLPRLADFALWATAGETAYAQPGTFEKAYDANLTAATSLALEASDVATALVSFIGAQKSDTWQGFAEDLLSSLSDHVGERRAKDKGWPKNARALSAAINRATPALKKAGIVIAETTKEGRKLRTVTRSQGPKCEGQTDGQNPQMGKASDFAHPENGRNHAEDSPHDLYEVGKRAKSPHSPTCTPLSKKEEEGDETAPHAQSGRDLPFCAFAHPAWKVCDRVRFIATGAQGYINGFTDDGRPVVRLDSATTFQGLAVHADEIEPEGGAA